MRSLEDHILAVSRLLRERQGQMKHELHDAHESTVQEFRQYDATIKTLRTKIAKLTRQRDEATGRANEYKSYALKYQKELIELKKGKKK